MSCRVVDLLVSPAAAFAHPKAGTEITPSMIPSVSKYAGQQLLTGAQAKAWADHFIAVHLSEMPYGGVYSKVSTASRANPSNKALAAEVNTVFEGTTLRGLLLEAYGFSVMAEIMLWGAIASFVLAGVLAILVGWASGTRPASAPRWKKAFPTPPLSPNRRFAIHTVPQRAELPDAPHNFGRFMMEKHLEDSAELKAAEGAGGPLLVKPRSQSPFGELRSMSVKRLGVLMACMVGLVLITGAIQAGAAGATQVLKFHTGHRTETAVGFEINSNVPPPIGSQFVLTAALYNAAPQFGKPTGARIGRVLADCTFLAQTPPNGDGVCSGIAHLPNGYFTFDGSGGFSSTKYGYWAITGGVGPYANDRGQLRTGGSTAVVTLSS